MAILSFFFHSAAEISFPGSNLTCSNQCLQPLAQVRIQSFAAGVFVASQPVLQWPVRLGLEATWALEQGKPSSCSAFPAWLGEGSGVLTAVLALPSSSVTGCCVMSSARRTPRHFLNSSLLAQDEFGPCNSPSVSGVLTAVEAVC